MDKIERMQENYYKVNYLGFGASFLLACAAMIFQEKEWLMHPAVLRLVLHALAALSGVCIAYFTAAWAMSFLTQKLMEPWFLIVTKRKKRNVKKLWLAIIACRPMISAAIYIAFAVGWETLQAEEFHRNVQMGQLTVDIIFALIGGMCLYNLSNYSAVFVEDYQKDDIREIRKDYRKSLKEWDEKYQNGGKILNVLYTYGIPILTLVLNIAIVWLTFKFVHH